MSIDSVILNQLNKVNNNLGTIMNMIFQASQSYPDNAILKEALKQLSNERCELANSMVGVASNIPSDNKEGNIEVAQKMERELREQDRELLASLNTQGMEQEEKEFDSRIV